jgi:hypothetical protein
MIVEHSIYLVIGILLVLMAEELLKIMVISKKQYRSKSYTSVYGILINKWSQFLKSILRINNFGFVWISIAAILIGIWHIPVIFNMTAQSQAIHIFQHASFIFVGSACFLASRSIGESFTIILIFSMAGMMALCGLGLILSNERIYIFYSLPSHNEAGEYMIISSMILLLGTLPAYIIKRTIYHINRS